MAKKIVVGHIVYNIGGESRELDVALTNSKRKVSGFTKFIKSAIGIGGAVIAFKALINIAKDVVQSYAAQEQAEAGLAAAIRATGGNVSDSMDRYNRFATSIQRVANVGDDVVLGLVQQAKSFGIADERIEEATRGAIGLSKAFDIDMNTALKGVALAYEGNFAQLSRYIPALRSAKTDAERMALVQKSMADGFEIAEAQAQTGTGALEQYSLAMDDLKEVLGKVVLEILLPLVQSVIPKLQELAEKVSDVRSRTADWAEFEKKGAAAVKNKQKYVDELGVTYKEHEATLLALKEQEAAYVDAGKRVPKTLREKIAKEYEYLAAIQKLRSELASHIPAERKRAAELAASAKAAADAAAAEKKLAEALALQEKLAGARGQQEIETINLRVEHERQATADLNNFRLAELDRRLADEKAKKDKAAEDDKKREDQLKQLEQQAMDFIVGIWGQLDSLNRSRLSADLAAVEANKQAELATFEGTEEEKQALIAEFDKEKARLEYESALKSWKLQQVQALASLAEVVLNALKMKPFIPLGLASMALAGILGGIQLAAIRAAKPVPSFAEGTDFVVPPGFENDTFPMNVESGERVQVTPAAEVARGGQTLEAHIYVDGRQLWQAIGQASRDGKILIAARAVVR